ncbi:DUF3857 domain-containing protein [Flavobacterium sp.]|uniref:DUF3857 domain-containing protein n=1 Tax=Flavobacterium sp. TaxID=239 RepID=UPI002B4B01BF|nr:DUF3857 domain-containing protein [Flavobacterium sp.]HLF50900.1 DUF3857 domain-containing protein [Flavobacterium sp.]
MKNKLLKKILTFTAILHSSLFFAQDYSFKNYDWKEKETTVEIPEQYKNQNEVILDRTIKIEVLLVGNVAKQYYLLHEKIYINADDAIERNNKIYIPFNQNETILTNKVRVILKNGKIIKLDKKDIKEEIDEEKGVKFNYFAINGLEKGAVIERILVVEEGPELDGKTFKMQDVHPIANLNFELIYPEHLIFKTKSYNGLVEPTIDSEKLDKKVILALSEKNIPALDNDEKYSNWDVKLKIFRYKLDTNLISGAKNLYNFKEFSTNFYERINPELDKKQLKAIDDFCKLIPKSNDSQEQIWNIENKIKKTITYNRYIDSKETLSDIIKTKQANQGDILKLYLAIFKNFQIENNVVFTSSRYKIPFDKDFESYENLNDLLFYFPTIKKYLTPTEIEYRIPLIPANLADNNGLFIKGKMFAGVAMGIGEINFIEIPGKEITHDLMDITVDFTKDIENPTITNKMTFGGYSAINFQPLKDFASAEEYKTILKSVAENYTVDTEYKTLRTENDGTEFIGKKPFIMEVTFEGKDLIQKAGDTYLFSIGQTIGKQMELYQENKRTLPVEIDNPHSYLRKIKILLPKGYSVKNLEKFVMDYKTQLNGKTEAAFTSNYNKNDTEITIENTEYYNIINYPLEKFDEYKAVINAAADFNKIVIILNKNNI